MEIPDTQQEHIDPSSSDSASPPAIEQQVDRDMLDDLPFDTIMGFAWAEKAGFFALLASFVIRIENSSSVNGTIVAYSSPTASIGGAIGLVCGGIALFLLKRTVPFAKPKRLIAALLVLGVGGFQVATGQGLLI